MATPKNQTFASRGAAIANARSLAAKGEISKAELRGVERLAKSKEDLSTVRDSEIKDDHRSGPQSSATGDKLLRALEKESSARRSGNGR